MDKATKVREVRAIRRQLDLSLMLRSFGEPISDAHLDALSDRLSELSALDPPCSLADIHDYERYRR